MSTEAKKVMVIGGGIAGLSAARELSLNGIQVELVEKADFLGGHAIQYACKATDNCQQCGACTVESVLKDVVLDPGIRVHLASEVIKISGSPRFKVQLGRVAVSDNDDTSKICQEGYEKNPVQCAAVKGFSKHNAIYRTADGRLNPDICQTADKLEVDAIIWATGFVPFDPDQKSTYRYSELANVVSGLDLERAKRASGSVLRPSDGKPPRDIAFIQCVGSRDERLGHLWCSQVCCPYALRSAMALKHRNPDANITVFYMDIQNTGNNFTGFYQQCRNDLNFIRTIPIDMYETDDDRIRTRYMSETDGKPVDAEFDLVVLSVGIMPGNDNKALADLLQTRLTPDGFAASTDKLHLTATDQKGVFLAGTVQGPKTIADSIAHAGHAAGEVIRYLRRAS
ncbi:MAG: CoB--CoM heterodisulfide reductase iron-sulfur subunit A family protein [Deltaproteobacteria bacterium]|nr:CoB--CoM heterodisulfide reductase iron-sulfur subunit A family protein [Deltaproteobacteria bacterium]